MELYKDHLFVEMYSENEGHLHGYKQILLSGKTDYQTIEIVDTHAYGRCLLLDGKMQSSHADEYIYHEMLVHPAMITHPDPKRVLIVGGGEGATLREALRYQTLPRVDMIEIDAKVLSFAKMHLPEWHQGSFDDKRCHVTVGDGRDYIENTREQYDLIIIDVSDPGSKGPAYMLYTRQFYLAVARVLAPNGLVALQAGTSSVVSGEIMASVHRTLQSVFPVVRGYEACIPSFDLPWGFCIASKHLDPKAITERQVNQRLAERRVQGLRAYDGETHEGLFRMTKALKDTLIQGGRVIEDQRPMYTPI